MNKNIKGFTIVELLIVIVVIAILAAISIVAYNGIQKRGYTSSGQSLASQVVKKYEALGAIKGAYYTSSAGLTGAQITTYANAAPTAPEAVIDNPGSVIAATNATTPALSNSIGSKGQVVSSFACAGGANVWYWDYSASTEAAVRMTAGNGC